MARLRLTERADKDIDKLARPVKGAMWDFMRKFRQDPSSPGLRFKQLKADSRLYSARVSDDYRALMLHVKDDEYMLVTVKHRSESYDNMDRYAYQINQVTGGIDFYRHGLTRRDRQAARARPGRRRCSPATRSRS